MTNPEKVLARVVTGVLLMSPLGCRVEPARASAPQTTPTVTAEPASPTSTSTSVPPTENPTTTATSTSEPSKPIPTQSAELASANTVYTADIDREIRIIISELQNQELLVAYIRRENCGGQETISPWIFPAKELRKQGNSFTGGNRERTFSAVPVRDTWRGTITDKLCSNDKRDFIATDKGSGPEVLGSEWIRAYKDIYGAPFYTNVSGALDALAKGCGCTIPRFGK